MWEIERKLARDDARPIIFYSRNGDCFGSELPRSMARPEGLVAPHLQHDIDDAGGSGPTEREREAVGPY